MPLSPSMSRIVATGTSCSGITTRSTWFESPEPKSEDWISSVGASASVSSLHPVGVRSLGSTTTLMGGLLGPMSVPLTVSEGSSRMTVLTPTRIAMESARSSCTRANDSAELKRSAGADCSPSILPVESVAALSVTCGLRCLHQCMKGPICLSHSASSIPSPTSTPSCRRASAPSPLTVGFGSIVPMTTRPTPAQSSDSVQGGVRPKWLHGSSVT